MFINPVLNALQDLGGCAKQTEVYTWVTEKEQISSKIMEKKLAGGVLDFQFQLWWTGENLIRAKYFKSSGHGEWALTEKGKAKTYITFGEIDEMRQEINSLYGRRKSDS